jgi:hypothetical protein
LSVNSDCQGSDPCLAGRYWRRDFLAVTPEGNIRFVSDGGIFVGGAPRPKGDVGYLTFCGEA